MKLTDQSGWTVLHHLANNDPNRIAHDKISKEEQLENLKDNNRYGRDDATLTTNRYQTQAPMSNFAKKKMMRQNRYNMYNNNYNSGLTMYYNA